MRRAARVVWLASATIFAASAWPAHAQHAPSTATASEATQPADTAMSMPMSQPLASPLGIPLERAGSGTSWLPDASRMYARHVAMGDWQLMLHGVAFVQYDVQLTPRGDEQLGSINWGMLMARHALAGGVLTLHGMMSLEPFTVGAAGYPLLLQTGESQHGEPLHDRQHPHDLFMELAALYERPVARNLAISLYAAPVGEPALGPVAYPHRPSAAADPFAPLSHHWQDATHITYGVLTAGIFSRRWKLEGSIFNGREPDEHRTGFDYAGRGLDSYSARLTVNPGARWSVSASYGYLKSPEELHPDEAQHRISASVLQVATLGERGELATALIWGANVNSGERSPSNSIVAEATLDLDGTNTLFGRAELVQKSAADLALDDDLALLDPAGAAGTSESEDARRFDVGALAAGYLREIASFPGGSIGVGVLASLDVVPRALEPAYDTRTPGGFAVFLRVRPRRTSTNMGGMRMSARPERPPIETRERGSGRRARSTE